MSRSARDVARLVQRLRREQVALDSAYRTPEDGPSIIGQVLLDAADALESLTARPAFDAVATLRVMAARTNDERVALGMAIDALTADTSRPRWAQPDREDAR